MVIFDATFALLLVDENADAPSDPETQQPIERARDRIEHLIAELASANVRIGIPTPALAEVLVTQSSRAAELMAALTSTYRIRTLPFDELAAVEVAMITAGERVTRTLGDATKAKVKYDRQILGTALSIGATALYTDDNGLARKARQAGMEVRGIKDLPLPPVDSQIALDLPEPEPE